MIVYLITISVVPSTTLPTVIAGEVEIFEQQKITSQRITLRSTDANDRYRCKAVIHFTSWSLVSYIFNNVLSASNLSTRLSEIED